jgi:hypothetical protein
MNGAFVSIADTRTCQNKNYINILHMFNYLVNVFDIGFVIDEIHGNNINKTLKLLCMGKKSHSPKHSWLQLFCDD